MGNFYVNIAVKGASTPALRQQLETLGCPAILTPPIDLHSFVYADFLGSTETPRDGEIARLLSSLPGADYAMVSTNMDDDFLGYELWARGERVDAYYSASDAFEPDEFDDEAPRGDTTRLRTVFPLLDEVAVRRVLDREDYVFALERHQDLFRLLNIPTGPAIMDYNYLQNGELPEGVAEGSLIRLA